MKSIASFLLIMMLGGCVSARNEKTQIQTAIDRGVEFLRKTQNPDGSWGTGTQTNGYEVYAWVPGTHDALRVGTTALCVMAMREAGESKAAEKGVEYLVTQGEARRDSGDMLYNVWAHTYTLQALALELRIKDDARIKAAAEWHLDRLVRYQTYLGGWNYYDFHEQTQSPSMGPTSFGTAAGLIALWEAKQSGIKLPDRLVMNGIKRLEEMRQPEGGFLYSHDGKYRPRQGANRLRGSIGRVQACNDALWLWNSPTTPPAVVHQGLKHFFAEHIFIDMGRKRPVPHESWYQTAGYYYYFGHYYTARLVQRLGDEGKKQYGPALLEAILPHQEADGSWWDFPMWDYHKPYGTAYAVMTLIRLR